MLPSAVKPTLRISLDRDDPGFQGDDLLGARIFLDGIEQRHVVTADEEQGIIVRLYVGIAAARSDSQQRANSCLRW
jgi:hypothetical protein